MENNKIVPWGIKLIIIIQYIILGVSLASLFWITWLNNGLFAGFVSIFALLLLNFFNIIISWGLANWKKGALFCILIQLALIVLFVLFKRLFSIYYLLISVFCIIYIIYLIKNKKILKFFNFNENINTKEFLKEFWEFLKCDSWFSLLASLLIALGIISLILLPLLQFFTGTQLPLVIVESCSMYHSSDFQGIFNTLGACPNGTLCKESEIYSMFNLSINNTKEWNFKNGINKGDIIFVVSGKNAKQGDVVIFNAGQGNPIIHRVMQIDSQKFTTKGDNNKGLLNVEQNVNRNNIVGKAVFRIPYLGWIKLIFFDWMKPEGQRGMCS